jgi:peptide chain release factor 3
MQFEVATYRMEHEFGAPIELTATPWSVARLTDAEGERLLRDRREAEVLHRANGDRYAVFRSEYQLHHFAADHPEVTLSAVLLT